MAESIHELEQAAQIVMAPPNVITPEQRQAAENVFLTFRKTTMPYNMCRHILENCKNEYVLFQAASTIKEAVIREWTLLQPSDVESLRTYLLHYITQNIDMQSYVREQMLQAVAVIFKRGTVDERYTDREALFSDVTQLLSSGNHTMQLVACSILTALLNEYSSNTRSSSVGLPWEFHCRCKVAFEQSDLKKVFLFSLQVLQEMEKVPSPLNREVTAVFNRFLAITEHVLCWEFLPKHIPKQMAGSFFGNENVSFKPPPSWREVVFNKELIEMLTRIHQKVRYNSEMAHHSLMCLSQLASINGQIFPDKASKVTFLTNFLNTFLQMLSSTQLQDYEALGIANVINNLVMFYPTPVFASLDNNLLVTFLQILTKLTCNFCQAAAREDAMHKDDTLFLEAFEKTLTAWTSFLNDSKDLTENLMRSYATEIFNTYLQCHLSPPDGTRSGGSDGSQADCEEYDELESDDRTKYKDQLMCVGLFGRSIPEHSIPLLSRLLEDRTSRLNGQLRRVQQSQTMSPGGDSCTSQESHILDAINEDINWLLLISCNVLTDDVEGETPMIPADIMAHSIAHASHIDIDMTLRVLASPGSSLTDIPGADQAADPVVRLVSAVLRLCEVEKRTSQVNLTCHLSPEVAGSCMWFLTRWVPAYLLPNESYYKQENPNNTRLRMRHDSAINGQHVRTMARKQTQMVLSKVPWSSLCRPGSSRISVTLIKAFGRDTEGGQWTVAYLLDKILSNLVAWNSEPKLIEDTMELLLSLVDKKERCDYVVKCDSFWKLVKNFSTNQMQFDILPAACKRLLCKALVLAGCASFENSTKEEYWSMVFNHLHEQYSSLVKNPEFVKNAVRDHECRRKIVSLLECMGGVADGSTHENTSMLFDFLHPIMADSITVLDVLHEYEDIVQLVLDLFNSVVNRQIFYLKVVESRKLYELCLSMIEIYARHNRGRSFISKDVEDDQYQDILTLLQLLTNTLSKDFVEFTVHPDEETHITSADVVLFGLNIIVPLMTDELLKFPALCTAYMCLLTYMGEIYPEKVCALPDHLLKTVLASEEMGLTHYRSDVVKFSLEFVTSIAVHVHQNNMMGSLVHITLQHFLEIVFSMLLLETFDMDLLETASRTYFSLICCHHTHYENLYTALIEKQTDAAVRQRLMDAFSSLTDGFDMQIDRQNRIKFQMKFDDFLVNVRGLLCIK